jgi:hypothetical protein
MHLPVSMTGAVVHGSIRTIWEHALTDTVNLHNLTLYTFKALPFVSTTVSNPMAYLKPDDGPPSSYATRTVRLP